MEELELTNFQKNRIQVFGDVERLSESLKALRSSLMEHLNDTDKSYEITLNKKSFEIWHPFDGEEMAESHQIKSDFIEEVVSLCVRNYLKRDQDALVEADPFGFIELLFRVEDPARRKMEWVEGEEEEVARVDENGEKITHLPLDTESFLVKTQIESEKKRRLKEGLDKE